jgi:hypothetical protein
MRCSNWKEKMSYLKESLILKEGISNGILEVVVLC